jgi:DNA-3-methyladenine glycosylase II
MVGEVEEFLSTRDHVLAGLIAAQTARWSPQIDEDRIWGLIRIVIAQQVSTKSAKTICERVRAKYPRLALGCSSVERIEAEMLRFCGLSPRKAACCARIANSADQILADVARGRTWEEALGGISGIGAWTLAVFRIMILREENILPTGDLGLNRAVAMHYEQGVGLEELSRRWSPFRSVACWYLWRSLGNPPLG